jgi:hypothetical protein
MTNATATPSATGRQAPRSSGRPLPDHKWVALPVLLTGTFLIVLDFFIVNVGLPSSRPISLQAPAQPSGSPPVTV